ncbi:MAG: DNA/RNA non-specific endonuclease [Bacilli bacterium]|nr:DNA/RNA non-specific endonuclease [Bacilli bacterium]
MKNKSLNIIIFVLCIILVIVVILYIQNDKTYGYEEETSTSVTTTSTTTNVSINKSEIPDYNGNAVIEINFNKPEFSDIDYNTESFEIYSSLDSLGRCGVAYANIGVDLMPTEKRGSISNVKPSGWQSVKYDNVPGKYLYNRCHLIGYQLTGENDNDKNLITCTRYMNATTMLYYEDLTADYIKKTNNHVLYRVTPIYDEDNLVAKGVQMEISSVEDKCNALCYNVFLYNIQDGIDINYKTGASVRSE